jgi:hypothetical protein
MWKVKSYPTGITVISKENLCEPYLYVIGPALPDDEANIMHRYQTCQQIADYLNGGNPPEWLSELYRVSFVTARDLQGTFISAYGTDQCEASRTERKELIDKLCSGSIFA